MKRIDYIRNCVEEKVGRLGDKIYNMAASLSYKKDCKSMAERIDAIVADVPAAKEIVLHGGNRE